MYVYQKQACLLYVNLKIKFIKEEKREKGEQLQNKRFKRPKKKKNPAICGPCLDPDLNKPTRRGILDTTKKTLMSIWKCKLNLFLNYDDGLVVI